MKFIFYASVFFFSSFSFASVKHYRIQTQIFIDGNLVSAPQIITNGSDPTEVTQVSENPYQELKMKVIASDKAIETVKNGILMKFQLEYKSDSKIAKLSPEIFASPGLEATIETIEKNPAVFMKVIAPRE